tara:strand:- start:12012 stop:12971 length:960 start_codon:yes stop_codon:yes gene_type:complete
MAVRSPLYFSGGNLIELSSGEINQWSQKAIYQYSLNPTAVLTVVSSSGANIDAISDTRLEAGATSQSSTAFVAEASTAEPGTVTVSYDKINLAYTATDDISNTSDTGTTFPVYYDSSAGAVRAMNLTDLLDTFIYPAVDLMIAASESSDTAGTYTITSSATAASNYTKVSASDVAVFTDTRADTSAYSSSGIPETLDQPTTVTNYYLHRRDGSDLTPDRTPVLIDGSNNIQEFSTSTLADLLGDWLRYTAAHDTGGYKITYSVGTSGSGNARGTNMLDTKLNGSGNYQTRQVGDDYRSQEFPNGSPATISTYKLFINKT